MFYQWSLFLNFIFVVLISFSLATAAEEQIGLGELNHLPVRADFVVVNLQQRSDFLPATRLSSGRIRQLVEVARDVYEVKPNTVTRVLGQTRYVNSVYDAEVNSCIAVYGDVEERTPAIFVTHKADRKIQGELADYHERFYPRVQGLVDTALNADENTDIFFVGNNFGAILAYLSAAKTLRDRGNLGRNQVKVVCFDMPIVSSAVRELSRYLPFDNVLNFHLKLESLEEKVGIPIKTLLLERIELDGVCPTNRILLLEESDQLIVKAYNYFKEQTLLKSMKEAGSVPLLSNDRNPVIHWLKRALFG